MLGFYLFFGFIILFSIGAIYNTRTKKKKEPEIPPEHLLWNWALKVRTTQKAMIELPDLLSNNLDIQFHFLGKLATQTCAALATQGILDDNPKFFEVVKDYSSKDVVGLFNASIKSITDDNKSKLMEAMTLYQQSDYRKILPLLICLQSIYSSSMIAIHAYSSMKEQKQKLEWWDKAHE